MTSADWRPVPGWEGLYEVSAAGEVRRVAAGPGTWPGRVLRQWTNRGGYLSVQLWRDGQPCRVRVHRLVAAAFLGPCPEGKEVNHRDGDPANSRATNLEYATSSGNKLHAYRTGLRTDVGEQHPRAKLTAAQVDEIRARYRPHTYGVTRLAREYGVSVSTVHAIVTWQSWRHGGAA